MSGSSPRRCTRHAFGRNGFPESLEKAEALRNPTLESQDCLCELLRFLPRGEEFEGSDLITIIGKSAWEGFA